MRKSYCSHGGTTAAPICTNGQLFGREYESSVTLKTRLFHQANTPSQLVTWPPAADKAPAAWSESVQIVACISCWVQSDVPLLTGYQCLTEASPSPNINMDKWHLDSSTLAWDQRHLIVRTGQRRTPIFNLDFERHVHSGESCYRQCTAGVHNPRTGDHSRSVGHLVQGHSENKCTSVFT